MNEIIENFKTVITQKYAQFTGRASRKEFGYYALVNFVLVLIAGILDSIISSIIGFSFLGLLLILALILPTIAISVRRLHDLGLTGWLYLVMIIPCVNFAFLIYLLVAPGQPKDNQYGTNPLTGNTAS